MSWFNASGFASLAKTALDQAQKTIDKALDIKDERGKSSTNTTVNKPDVTKPESNSNVDAKVAVVADDRDSFFAEFGVSEAVAAHDSRPQAEEQQPSTSVWGSFTGSFFDTGASSAERKKAPPEERTIATQPKKAKSTGTFDPSRDSVPRRQRSVSAEDRTVPPPPPPPPAVNIQGQGETSGRLRQRFDTCPGDVELFRGDDGERSVRRPVTSEPRSVDSSLTTEHGNDHVVDVEPKASVSDMAGSAGSALSLSEKDCHSSSTLTPDVFSDSGESFVPVIMSGSWGEERYAEALSEEEQGTDCAKAMATATSAASTRTMLEEAMVESGTRSPHSTASSSEPTKVESEENSGHTSGDEAETVSSSDIEIISPNGEPWCTGDRNNSPACVSLSPVKQRQGPRTSGNQPTFTDSPSSGSPPRCGPNSPKGWHHRNASEMSVSSEESDGSQATMDALLKKLGEMSRTLDAREAKVLELSKENAKLRDGVAILESQMKRREEAHSSEALDVTNLTKEFTERMSRKEKEIQTALKEKENLQKELRLAKEEIVIRVSKSHVDELLKEKELQAAELMQEGEKLSKQLLQQSNIIKKLRNKEKESDTLLAQQKVKLQELSDDADRAAKALAAKEEIEKRQIEAVSQLTGAMQKLELEMAAASIRCNAAEEKARQAQSALEDARKEMAKWKSASVEASTLAQEAKLSAEMTAKEELRCIVDQIRNDARLEQEGLIFQLEQLRNAASAIEDTAGSREESLRQHVAGLQTRLQEVEARNEELTLGVASATRPLLRQIDNLQAALKSQVAQSERTEKNLNDKLSDAVRQLGAVTERERTVTSKYAEVSSKLASLQSENQMLLQEKLGAQVKLETESTKISQMEESSLKCSALVQELRRSFAEETERLRREKETLEHHLEIEKVALETERRRRVFLQEQLSDKDERFQRLDSKEGRRDSDSSFRRTQSTEEDPTTNSNHQVQEPFGAANYEGLRTAGGVSTVLENLQAQLKQREGEITVLQSELAQLGRVRESMTREMVLVNSTNEALAVELDEHRTLLDNYRRMEGEYNALLQMYGEKVEQIDELQLDLQDVKEMYKAQIDELTKRPC